MRQVATPVKIGEYLTQGIAHAVGMSRDRFVVKVISEKLNKSGKAMTVCGKRHLEIQRKTLGDRVGIPIKQYKLSRK